MFGHAGHSAARGNSGDIDDSLFFADITRSADD
jgi:hypothetical protein